MFNDLSLEFFSWVRGALLLLFLINSSLYIQNRKRLFLYHSLYLLFVFFFLLEPVLSEFWVEFYDAFGYSLLFLSFVFYVEFERVLLSTRVNIPKWDRYLVVKKYAVLLVSLCLPIIYFLYGREAQLLGLFAFLNILNIFVVRTYFVLKKIKGRNVHFFIFGSVSFLALGNIGAYFIVVNRHNLEYMRTDSMMFIYLGVLVEALVFVFIIGNIFKQILEKKANLKLQIALKQKESAELRMTALQSQMNPHFLFNSLNSINNFVLRKDKEEASNYITSFSKLVRKILKNSERLEISLFEELQVLEVYINLEKTRLVGGFVFIKNIDSSLNLHNIIVPPLFLQPFIENSIWHGLAGKKGEKMIKLNILKEDENLLIIVEDNGIGISDDVIEKNRTSKKRKFFGSSATEKRIKLMYNEESVRIITENINRGNDTGTRVTVSFPLRR